MRKMRILALTLSVIMLSAMIPLASLAAPADTTDVGGYNVRFITDFENFDDGTMIGDADALTGTKQNGLQFGVKNGYGKDGGKAYVLGAIDDPNLSGGIFAEASYKPQLDSQAKLNLQGATDFVFWLDGTGEPDDVAFMIVIGERDFDENGDPVMKENKDTGALEYQLSWRNLWDGLDTKYYTLADGESTWTEYTGTTGSYLRLSNTFKGYVRIPLETLELCWGTQDVNDTFDFKYLTQICFYYGIYSRHTTNGYAVAIDNIGFAGDFKTDVSTLTVDAIADQTKTDSEIKPALTVKDGDKVLVEGTDYTVKYSANVEAGKAAVTITGKGDYAGTRTVNFNIVAKATASPTKADTGTPPSNVKTGENANYLPVVMLIAAAAALLYISVKRKSAYNK